jgi:hypothetical protein
MAMSGQRVTRPGKAFTLDEHREIAQHMRAVRQHLAAVSALLSGRVYVKYLDDLNRYRDHKSMRRLRSRLEDEMAALQETKRMDNREFCSVYYDSEA